MTQKEFDFLTRIEKEIDKSWEELSQWEQSFAEKLLERFRIYGKRTMISPKEWEVIANLSDKIL